MNVLCALIALCLIFWHEAVILGRSAKKSIRESGKSMRLMHYFMQFYLSHGAVHRVKWSLAMRAIYA